MDNISYKKHSELFPKTSETNFLYLEIFNNQYNYISLYVYENGIESFVGFINPFSIMKVYTTPTQIWTLRRVDNFGEIYLREYQNEKNRIFSTIITKEKKKLIIQDNNRLLEFDEGYYTDDCEKY